MKRLTNFIHEKLHINQYKNNALESSEVEGPLTPGIDYNGDEVVIFGKPFKEIKDKNYEEAVKLIKKYGFENLLEYGDVYGALDGETEWVLAGNEKKEVALYSYDKNGAIGYKNMNMPFNL